MRTDWRSSSVARDVVWAVAIGVAAVAASAIHPALGLAVAVAAGFLLLVPLHLKVLAYFVALPVAGWFSVRFPELPFGNAPDLIALAMLVHLGVLLVAHRERVPLAHPLVAVAGVFILIVVLQSRNPVVRPTGQGLAGARVYLEPAVLFLVGLWYWQRARATTDFLKATALAAVPVGVVMLRQLLIGFNDAERTFLSGSEASLVVEEKKIFATMQSPDQFGFVAALLVIVAIAMFVARVWPPMAAALAIGGSVGVLVSGLRMSLVALTLAAITIAFSLGSRERTRPAAQFILGIGLAGALGLGALVMATPVPDDRADTQQAANAAEAAIQKFALFRQGTEDDDLGSRLERTGSFLDYIAAHPEGTGPGIVGLFSFDTDACLRQQGPCFASLDVDRPPLPDYVLDTPFIFQGDFLYFTLGVELGVPGLAVFLSLLALGGASAYRSGRREAGAHGHEATHHAAAVVAIGTLVLVAVYSLTNEAFRTPQVAGYFWFLLAALVVLESGPLEPPASRPVGRDAVERQPASTHSS